MPPRKLSSLQAWLLRVDPSGGFDKYWPDLRDNFDCAEQLIDAYVIVDGKRAGGRRLLDTRIFDDIGINDLGDRRKLEAWFLREVGVEVMSEPVAPIFPAKFVAERPPEHCVEKFANSVDSSQEIPRTSTSHEHWLMRVDRAGNLSAYLPTLREHFDCAEQVIEAYIDVLEPSGHAVLDPQIFADLGIGAQAHRHLLAEWFKMSVEGGIEALIRRCRDDDCDRHEADSGKLRTGQLTPAASVMTEVASTAGSVPPPTPAAKLSRPEMTPREEALRPWCASHGMSEDVLDRLRSEDVWCPDDLAHLDRSDLADIVRGMKKGVQGRFYSAVHGLRQAKGLSLLLPAAAHGAEMSAVPEMGLLSPPASVTSKSSF